VVFVGKSQNLLCLPAKALASEGTKSRLIAELRSAEQKRSTRAGKNSFPPTPFLFARLLGLRPDFFRRKITKRVVGGLNKLY